MNKYLIVIFLIAASMPLKAQATLFRQRLAVDSIAAVRLVNQEIGRLNQPTQQTIDKLQPLVHSINNDIRSLNDKVNKISRIEIASDGKKIKDKDAIATMTGLFPEMLERLPTDSIYSRLIKPSKQKDRMYKSERAKQLEKELNNIRKKVSKGNFSHPFICYAFSGYKKDVNNLLSGLSRKKNNYEKEIAEAKKKLIPRVKKFKAEQFFDFFGADKSIPTRTIYEGVRFTYPEMVEDYDKLVERYYNTPDKLLNFKVTKEVAGKFDGLLTDTIGMFPLESMKSARKEEYEPETVYYNGIMLKSKYNTIDPIIIDLHDLTRYTPYNDVTYTLGPDGTLSPHVVELINGTWEKGGKDKDGISVLMYPYESTKEQDFTFIYEDGKWQRKQPLTNNSRIYAEITLANQKYIDSDGNEVVRDRTIILKTDETVADLNPDGKLEQWTLDAAWSEDEDDVLDIFTGEGTSHYSVIGDYIYYGAYSDGQCWVEEWVGGPEGGPEGGLEWVGYKPDSINGEKLKSLKFYKDREKYRKMTKLSVHDLVDREDEWFGGDYTPQYFVRDYNEVEKTLKEKGFVLAQTKNTKVIIGTDDESCENPEPGIEKIFKSPDCEVALTIWKDYERKYPIEELEIKFHNKEALDYFVSNLKKSGWTTENGFHYDISHHDLLILVIVGNGVYFDIGP